MKEITSNKKAQSGLLSFKKLITILLTIVVAFGLFYMLWRIFNASLPK
ncbi:hypothetical protein J4458_01170 [Candidatus Woesearchaeota archaeon]|nr:hypothetical protein [Candidatus Woesearchaeota archaeon]